LLLSRQPAEKNGGAKKKKKEKSECHVCSAYKPYFSGQQTVFSYHNKSANSTFSHGFSVMALVQTTPDALREQNFIPR
jgi:hypothetical protein